MRHIYRCPLRWADMDAYGHVNNVVFLRYLEEARIDFLFRPDKEFKQGRGWR
ncbi:acyl-CoA thioesterase, partial [Kitasatospora sp. NPDC056789]|uniref:acyl-CoA thioesterase n=1 Tax=Kitasatospora sp. NPDC056789 TaxID=3345945 RepID=UPI0036811B50